MSTLNIDEYKIPVISGINDAPIPPNFNGNGKGSNGAYYVERLNKLADLFTNYSDLPSISNFYVNESYKEIDIEVGSDIQTPLVFTYDIQSSNPNFTIKSDLYYGFSKEVLNIASQNIQSGLNYVPSPKRYNDKTTVYWVIKTTIDNVFNIESDYIITNWKKPIIFGSSIYASISSNIDGAFTLSSKVLVPNEILTIEEFTENRYVYLFSPVKIAGLKIFDNGIKIPVIETENSTVFIGTSISFNDYYLYRTIVPTRGNFSFEIVP